jgi:polar amino acid transport system substrate-binding protein
MFSEEQAEAWKSDEMFRLLVSGAKDYAIILLDDTGHVVRWNDGAQRVQGFSAQEIIGSHCSRFYTDDDIKADKPEVELRLARIAGRFQDEGWRVRADGSKFWASFELTALRDKEGTLTGFGNVVRDVTDRKDAQERLRKSEEMFRLLVLGVKDYAIVMLNTDGNVVSWNEGVQRIKGYRASEILGTHFARFYTKDDRESGKPDQELKAAARDGRFETEGWRVRKDQSRFRAHVVITALYDDDGHLVGFGEVTRDITLQKDAEEALKAAKEQAEQASRFKSEFLANMSHEIRTPMNGIIGITNILLRSPLAEQQHQNLTILRDVGVSLLSVINDILDFSKVEAGKLQLESVEFEPLTIVEGIGDFFAAQARAANISLITCVAPDLPQFLTGDAGRLRQILTNLTSNAIKFSANGEVIIKAKVQSSSEQTVTVRFDVIDTGVGIPEEAIERIFSPFVQADGSTNRKYGGTGLGLSISKRLVDLMGGEIGVNSRLGSGTNFWFTIPFVRSSSRYQTHDRPPNFESLRILLLDDISSSREVIASYFEEWKINYVCVGGVADALFTVQCARESGHPLSLVLINLSADPENLVASASELLRAANEGGIEVILAYGLGDSLLEQKLSKQYLIRRISKPIKRSDLLNCLATFAKATCQVQEAPGQKDSQDYVNLGEEFKRRRGQKLDRNKKILIVEDNLVNKKVILMELEELGLSADAVSNGAEALQALCNHSYAVVLMDCQMPEMDGLEATRLIRMRERSTGGHIPIVAMTAQALDGDREKCIAAGMDDYLSKPIDYNLLEASLERWIPLQSSTHPTAHSQPDLGEQDRYLSGGKPAVVDLSYLENKYKRERMRELIQLFIDSSGHLLEKIERAIEAKDNAGLKATAHELAGSCLMLRMEKMLKEARNLETIAQGSDWPYAELCSNRLKDSFTETKAVVMPVLK